MKRKRGRTFRERQRKKSVGDSDINDQKYSKLLKWMVKAGYQSEKKLVPKNFPVTGRGLMTKQSIKCGDIIISVPENLLITPQKILFSELGYYIKCCHKQLNGIEILAVFLICEKSKGRSSYWYPYIATLPESYSTPSFIDIKILSNLPSLLYQQAEEQIQRLRNSFYKQSNLFHSLEKVFPEYRNIFTFENYRWAFFSVNTRCVYKFCGESGCQKSQCKQDLVLVPFLDLLNHDVNIEIEAGFNSETNCYQIKSLGHLQKYRQVFINYGHHNNRKLFLEYGFILNPNIHDVIPISIDDILLAWKNVLNVSLTSENLQSLRKWKLLCNLGISSDGPSWTLETLLKVLSHDNDFKRNMALTCGLSTLTANQQLQVERILQEIISQKLKEYENLSFPDDTTCIDDIYAIDHIKLASNLINIEKYIFKNYVFLLFMLYSASKFTKIQDLQEMRQFVNELFN